MFLFLYFYLYLQLVVKMIKFNKENKGDIMRRGFTMIELLAVFTLLGIIVLFTMPQITSMLKKGNDKSYEQFKKTVYIATESYVVEKKISIANGSSTNIYLKDLMNDGYLKSTLVNPNNNKKVSELTSARVLVKKNSDGILSYEYFES